MKIKNKNFTNKTLIIAEIGNNHEGSFKNALKLISKAADCGVDAVKFQYIVPELFICPLEKKRIKQLNNFLLSKKQFIKLKKHALKKKVIFFSSCFDEESANFLNSLQNLFKIASCDNNYFGLIKKIIKFNKPVLISLGLTEGKDTENLIKFINTLLINNKKRITLMHCVSSYPVLPENANLNKIDYLIKKYPNYNIGYSDHTKGIEASCIAVSKGAKVIEKHFTLSKKFSSFRDHQLSADPKEMELLVKNIRNIEKLIKNNPTLSKDERKNIKNLRRSVFVKKTILKNSYLKKTDLICLRPGHGISPDLIGALIGKKLKNTVTPLRPIKFKDIFIKKNN